MACRDIGPNPAARFQSLSAVYADRHIRPGGGDTGLGPPTTFVAGSPDWARYQRGRSFDLTPFNDEARRCLMSALGYIDNPATPLTALPSLHQDLRGTLAMIDYFRRHADPNNPASGGNRANPNDPNDAGDPNVITQFEIEHFVWQSVQGVPESDRWAHMRDQGDGTMARLHAVLGLVHYLSADVPTENRQAPAPEIVRGEASWFSQNRFWMEMGGLAAATGLACLLGVRLRRARVEAREARAETQRIEGEISGVREQIQRIERNIAALEARRTAGLDSLRVLNGVDLTAVTPRVQALRQRLEAARQELSLAQAQLDGVNQRLRSNRRPSRSLKEEQAAAQTRLDGALGEYGRIEIELQSQQAAQGIGRAYQLLGSRPASN